MQRDPNASGLLVQAGLRGPISPVCTPGIMDGRNHYRDGANLYGAFWANGVQFSDPSGLSVSIPAAGPALPVAIGATLGLILYMQTEQYSQAVTAAAAAAESFIIGKYEQAEAGFLEADLVLSQIAGDTTTLLAQRKRDIERAIQSLSVPLLEHLAKVEGLIADYYPEPPGGPFRHWLREVRAWLESTDRLISKLPRKAQDAAREQWREWLRRFIDAGGDW